MNLIPADSPSADPDEAKTEIQIQPGLKPDPSADTMITIDEVNNSANSTPNGTVVVIQPGSHFSKTEDDGSPDNSGPSTAEPQNSVDV